MALQKITKHVLHDNIISGQSTVTAATNDFVLIQDVSDSNTLKKALISDFGVAGISSSADATAITINSGESVTFSQNVTVAGDLTVDTNTLYVDSADNRVGIGTTNPSYVLDINGGYKFAGKSELTASAYWVGAPTHGFRFNSNDDQHNNVIMYDSGNTYFRGNVGIGITSALTKAHIQGSSASTYTGAGPNDTLRVSQSTDGNWISSEVDGKFAYFGIDSSNAKFAAYDYPGSAEMGMVLGQDRVFIKNDGNVGIGTGASDGPASGSRLHVKGNAIFLEDSPISTSNTNAVPAMSNSSTGGLHFYSSASSTTEGLTFSTPSNGTQAGIVCHNNNSDGTHLGFFTTNSYAAGPQCRWKMTNYGTLLGAVSASVGSTTATSTNAIQVDNGDITVTAANNGVSLTDLLPGYSRGDYGAIKSSANYIYFVIGSSYVSNINTSGTYGASDLRLKTNVSTISGALSKVNQLRGVNFEWKDEDRGTGNNLGFIAQEMETVLPELVNEAGLPNDENGEAPIKSVNYANLTSVLVEAVKELSAKNDALEDRIKTLEG